jgi:hypothetical protein
MEDMGSEKEEKAWDARMRESLETPKMITHTPEGWPLVKQGDEIVWRGIRWMVVRIDGDEMLIRAFARTKKLSNLQAKRHSERLRQTS